MAASIPILRALVSSAPPRAAPVTLFNDGSNAYVRSLETHPRGGSVSSVGGPSPHKRRPESSLPEQFFWDEKELKEEN